MSSKRKIKTFIVGISGTATSSLLIEAKDQDEAEQAASAWLEKNDPARQDGFQVEIDYWDLEVGSTEVWREGEPLPESIKASEVLAVDE